MGKLVEGINMISNLMSSAANIHDKGKYLASQIPSGDPTSSSSVKLTIECPKQVTVNESVTIKGTAPPGIIEIYSDTQLERDGIYPNDNSQWGTRLFFTVEGHYILYARERGDVVKCELDAYKK